MFKIGKEVVKEVPYEITIVKLKNLQSANIADGTELFVDWSREKNTDKKGTTPPVTVQKYEAVWNPPITVRLVSDFLRDTKSGKLKPKRLIFRLKKKPDAELGVLWINASDYYGLGLRENVTIPFQSPLGVFGLECHICVYHKDNMERKSEPSGSKTMSSSTSAKFLRRSRSDLSAVIREQKRTVNPLYLKGGAKSENKIREPTSLSPNKSAPTSPLKDHLETPGSRRSMDKSATYDDVMRGLAEADSDSGSTKEISRTNSFSSEQSSDDEAFEIQFMVNPKTGYGKIPIQVTSEERSLQRLSASSSTEDPPSSSPIIQRKTTLQTLPKKAYSHYGSVNGVRKLSELSIQDDKESDFTVKRPPKGQYGKIPVELQEEE